MKKYAQRKLPLKVALAAMTAHVTAHALILHAARTAPLLNNPVIATNRKFK